MIFSPFFNSITALVPSREIDLTSLEDPFISTTDASFNLTVFAVVFAKTVWLPFAIV